MKRPLAALTALAAAATLALAGCGDKVEAPDAAHGSAAPSTMPDGTGGAGAPSSGTGEPTARGDVPQNGTEAGGAVTGEDEELLPPSDLPDPVQAGSGEEVRASDSGPVEGKVRVIVYQDLMCPYCKQFEDDYGQTLAEWADNGDVVVDHRVVSILDGMSTSEYSTRAGSALACVADVSPSAYANTLRALYAAQDPETEGGLGVSEGGPGLSDSQLAQLAEDAGASEDVADCIDDQRFVGWVTQSTDRAKADGMRGTPTVVVGGKTWDQQADFEDWAREIIDADA
jgi:protein-disulfide isomerase